MFLFLLVLTARISMLFLSLFSSSQGAQIGKIGRGDVCESTTIIVFPFPRKMGNAMTQIIPGVVIGE